MKIGDRIRLVKISPSVKDDGEFKTRTMLTNCLGCIFTIKGFQADGGRFRRRGAKDRWVELAMAEAIPGVMDTIWVEPDSVELVRKARKKQKRTK